MAMNCKPNAFQETIKHLAARWSGATPLLPAFSLLARGDPVPIAHVADVAGVTVEELQMRLDAARCERDKHGCLIDLFGMTLRQTSISLEIEEKSVYSCCALWAVMIPKLVRKKVVVRSTDPMCNEPIHLVASPDAIEIVDPPGTMATLAVADASVLAAGIGPAFCSQCRYFSSQQSAGRFVRTSNRGFIVSLKELHEAGRDLLCAIKSSLEK